MNRNSIKLLDGMDAAIRWTSEILRAAHECNHSELQDLCKNSLQLHGVQTTTNSATNITEKHMDMAEGTPPKNHNLRFHTTEESRKAPKRLSTGWGFKQNLFGSSGDSR